ncbi:MAG: hypothetical protein DRG83_04490 [Deltaproteobacteria bacterium]|nr:MAG: hypothetical protein DRG83_04490 [Deltaproteobacteria bacterium]
MKVYEIITNQIISLLEKGEIPWKKPWKGALPQNLITRRPYEGVNRLLLMNSAYTSPYWLTFLQAKNLGGYVKEGEKATTVVFWKWYEIEEEDEETGEMETKAVPVLRYYKVFNLEQCVLPEDKIPKPKRKFNPLHKCEKTVKNMPDPPEIRHGGDRAFYDPVRDQVTVPYPTSFEKREFYYATLFHELVHSTGHEKRLARKKKGDWQPFGTEDYSREELIAELGACFLCAEHNIAPTVIENSAAYIQGWLKQLRNDKRLIVLASAQAEKAVRYIMRKEV